MKKKKRKVGGPQPGSGRRLKYGEKTTVIRIPESLRPKIEQMISRMEKKSEELIK